MGLTGRAGSWFATAASARPHVLIAAVPGFADLRIAAEAAAARHHAVLAASAADADVLLVAGRPGPQLTLAIDVLWAQLPGPRARVQVATADDLDDAFAVASEMLADTVTQRADAHARGDTWAGPSDTSDTDVARMMPAADQGHDSTTMRGPRPSPPPGPSGGAPRQSGAGHTAHGDDVAGSGMRGGHPGAHDMGDDRQPRQVDARPACDISPAPSSLVHDIGSMGEMDMPGGLMMAERAEDRDGLKLDVLHVPLGPFLPGWPAGLVIHARLQGDIIQSAHAQVLDHSRDDPALDDPAFDDLAVADVPGGDAVIKDRARAVAALDALAALLTAADWRHAAAEARAVRDDLRADPTGADASVRLRRLDRRVARSRVLRARGTSLGCIDPSGAGADLAGDSVARWLRWLAIATSAVSAGSPGRPPTVPQRTSTTRQRLEHATGLIVGLDLGAARVLIASLDIRPGEQAVSPSASTEPAGV
jgi:hypothetical protein